MIYICQTIFLNFGKIYTRKQPNKSFTLVSLFYKLGNCSKGRLRDMPKQPSNWTTANKLQKFHFPLP